MKNIGSAVMIEHTLFSLPLAISAFLLETAGHPPIAKVIWILLAVFGARNAANALNRLIDRHIDEENPRTATRDLPTGKVKPYQLWIFTILCLMIFLLAAYKLNPLCLILVPVAFILIFGYSYTKRFTFLCHYWLGVTTSVAVMGSFLAISGSFAWEYFPLTIGAALWVAGFDIIYATQDIEHDRTVGLHSIPSRFGKNGALYIAGLSHMVTILAFILNGYLYQLHELYYIGVTISGIILVMEHVIAWKGNVKWIPLASYHLNQLLSPLFMIFTILDIYLLGNLNG